MYNHWELIMQFCANVIVELKEGVRDPHGYAITSVIRRNGLGDDIKVNAGKFYSILLNAETREEANQKLEKICETVLSNPVLESYKVINLKTNESSDNSFSGH